MFSNILLPIFLAGSLSLYFLRRRRLRLPPGPTGYPLLGNLKELIRGPERKHAWIEYAELGAAYGDVLYLESFGQSFVLLNSARAAFDLLEKRSTNYSDRPMSTMLIELSGWDWAFGFKGYTDSWRLHRKTFHQYFQQRAITNYHLLMQHYCYEFLRRLLASPQDFCSHASYFSGSTILKIVYDYELQGDNDPYLKLFKDAMESADAALRPGAFLVDLIPALKYVPAWFPGAAFQQKARIWKKAVRALRDIPYDLAKQRIESRYGAESLVAQGLAQERSSPALRLSESREDIIKNCAASAYLAGEDSSTATILSFILAMVHHPDVLRQAQEEMDRVVGRSRLPCFDDRSQLPYLEAVYLETFRWLPITPLSVPRRSVHDDSYEGYLIPKRSIIITNTWAMMHNPDVYPRPTEFKPERFLPRESQEMPPLPTTFGFGFGRRICPGRYFAMEVIWLGIASMIATFNIVKAQDENGNEITPIIDMTDGAVSHPLPFKCSITPRSAKHIRLIQRFEGSDESRANTH